MVTTLLLPWFPIILAVGVGARLLGAGRGLAWSVLCSLFWVALSGTIASEATWNQPISFVTLLAGVAAILTMGAWAGGLPLPMVSKEAHTDDRAKIGTQTDTPSSESLEKLAAMFDQFDQWLEEQVVDDAVWAKFDEFIRSALFHCCGATQVRPYRMSPPGSELVPLNEAFDDWESRRIEARTGIVGHVVTSGRAVLGGDPQQSQLLAELARESRAPLAWCFPIRDKRATIGVITVGEFRGSAQPGSRYLRIVERFVQQAWRSLTDRCGLWSALQNDPVTGLLSKQAFLESAAGSVSESYALGEPVTVAVFALEGVRSLNDSGLWDLADDLAKEVSETLRRKVRADDRIGRFDGSRYVLLLRRVDSELASLIIRQLMGRLTRVCADEHRWRIKVNVRCGLAGSGTDHLDIANLVSNALTATRTARLTGEAVITDLPKAVTVGSSPDED